MRFRFVHLLLACGLVLAPAVAQAQLYVGAGFGEGAGLEQDLDAAYDTEGEVSGRLFAGKRFGPWGVELAFFGTDLTSTVDQTMHSTTSLGIDLKYHLPITTGLELYVRGGLAKTWIGGTAGEWQQAPDAPRVAQGSGYDYGLGAQYAFSFIPRVRVGVFLDVGEQVLTLRDDLDTALEGKVQMTTLGLFVMGK